MFSSVVIRRDAECNVDSPPDSCLNDGSAFSFTFTIERPGIQHFFHGIGIYTPKIGVADVSATYHAALRRTIAALQQQDPSRHPYMVAAESCGNDQLNDVAFDKTLAAYCIYARAEGGSTRSIIVLVGSGDEDNYYMYLPTGLLVKFEVAFRRRVHGRERAEAMTVIVQL